jgi:hypothetical protein
MCILDGRLYENGGDTISEMDMDTGKITREFHTGSAIDGTSPIVAVEYSHNHILFRAHPFELSEGGFPVLYWAPISYFSILDTSTGKITRLIGDDVTHGSLTSKAASKKSDHVIQIVLIDAESVDPDERSMLSIGEWDIRTGERMSRTSYDSDCECGWCNAWSTDTFFSPGGKYSAVVFPCSNLQVWGEYNGACSSHRCNGLVNSHATQVHDVVWLGDETFACIAEERWDGSGPADPDEFSIFETSFLEDSDVVGVYLEIYTARLRTTVNRVRIEYTGRRDMQIHATPCGGFIVVSAYSPLSTNPRETVFRVHETSTLKCIVTGTSPLPIVSVTRSALVTARVSDVVEVGTLRLSPILIDCPGFRLHADGTLVNHVQSAALPNPPCDPVLWKEASDIVALNLARPIGERFCLGDNPLVATRFDLLQTILFHSRGATQKSGTWIPREILKIIAGYAFAD